MRKGQIGEFMAKETVEEGAGPPPRALPRPPSASQPCLCSVGWERAAAVSAKDTN